eukprot:CAMPEP_0206520848 /NCGR_PEP_ID=MMETSP0324_2-20121206/65996_1 /ASSEMBLY_ACC=CAM_ASM_000836 /TAXON_ID=2866 /ORGANISM="Crypthecodinium cohnii, Strain Seligo" /LENGTH=58 /DNA_ID=CAMNT_0054014629 /DNA_START=61 /DNA_END=234 /DNA_ORIENTATION=+
MAPPVSTMIKAKEQQQSRKFANIVLQGCSHDCTASPMAINKTNKQNCATTTLTKMTGN